MGNTITRAQKALYWRNFGDACHSLGLLSSEAREDYRHKVMLEETGKLSLRDLNRTDDMDAVLARFAADAQSYGRAASYSGGTLTRLHYLIRETALSIVVATGRRGSAWEYVAGVMLQARILPGGSPAQWAEKLANASAWMDIPETDVRKVLMSLQVHARRVKRGAA